MCYDSILIFLAQNLCFFRSSCFFIASYAGVFSCRQRLALWLFGVFWYVFVCVHVLLWFLLFFLGIIIQYYFFFGEIYVFLFTCFFWQLARCVVLAANDLSGDYLLCCFDIVFMCIISYVYCFFLCVTSQYLGWFGTVCVSFFLDQEMCLCGVCGIVVLWCVWCCDVCMCMLCVCVWFICLCLCWWFLWW